MLHDKAAALREQYKVAVEDERHYRGAYQARLAYHTNVVLVSAAAIVASLARMQTVIGVVLLGISLSIVGGFAILTPNALKRLYRHFLEHLDSRERIEVLLGIRHPNGVAAKETVNERMGGTKPEPRPPPPDGRFLSQPLFTTSWVGNSKKGYFGWMESGFRVGGGVMVILGLAIAYWADDIVATSRADLGDTGDDLVTSAGHVSVEIPVAIGPFALGEPCFTDANLVAQVDSAVAILRRLSASAITLIGSVDAVPMMEHSPVFRTNAGLASARARCVAGWMVARDAEGMRAVRVSLQNADGGLRLLPGSPEHRRVFVRALVPNAPASGRALQQPR